MSSDINRGWRMGNAALMEHLRWRFLANATSGSVPLAAEVFGGLLVRPIAATMGLSVDPGALAALDSGFDASGDVGQDDSDLVFASIDAVYTNPAFVIAGNASGSARWDFIECRPVLTVVETDNRDIFDPETQLFTAALVNKVTKASLEFRVRAGTGGAGLPALAVGWLPLCAVHVPNAAGSVDTMTFYDVRPMLEDIVGPRDAGRSRMLGSLVIHTIVAGPTSGQRGYGSFTGSFNGRQIGGPLVRCSPGTPTNFDFRSFASTEFDDLGTEHTSDNGTTAFSTLYTVFPRNLPRWQRYADSPAARVPVGPKGLMVMSGRLPTVEGFEQVGSFTMPSAYSMGSPECLMVPILSTIPSIPSGGFCGARWHDDSLRMPYTVGAAGGLIATAPAPRTLVPNVDFPAYAKFLHTAMQRNWSGVTLGVMLQHNFAAIASQAGVNDVLTSNNDGNQDEVNRFQEIIGSVNGNSAPNPLRDSGRIPVVLPNVNVLLDASTSQSFGSGAVGTTYVILRGWDA